MSKTKLPLGFQPVPTIAVGSDVTAAPGATWPAGIVGVAAVGPAFTSVFVTPDIVPLVLQQEIAKLVSDPRLWWHTPHAAFNCKSPVSLIGTEEERLVFEWIESVKNGFTT